MNFSETDEEISMILPKDLVTNLPSGPLKVDVHTVWRAVEVLEGSLGFCTWLRARCGGPCLTRRPASTGIVQSLSKPLAAAGISILYVSTFDTDYVLIEERNLVDAVASLRSQHFAFMLEGEQECYEDTPSERQVYIAAGSPPPFQKRVCRLAVLPDELLLCKFRERLSGDALVALLRLAFYAPPSAPSRFFSFTATGTTNSIMLSRSEFARFAQSELLDGTHAVSPLHPGVTHAPLSVCADPWRVIKVDEGPLGFAATGIVSSLAVPLSEARISIFYVSAYLTDFLLVRAMDFSDANRRLTAAGFTVRGP